MTSSPRPSPREIASQKVQIRKQQEKLFSDLLTVVDALDRAAEHWQKTDQQIDQQAQTPAPSKASPKPWWQRWQAWFQPATPATTPEDSESLAEVVTSAREGIEMIQASLLSVLNQHQVTPLSTQGLPFDPQYMHALSQQADADAPPNTVVQEVVRGYRWKDRILREAQVIVAGCSEAEIDA